MGRAVGPPGGTYTSLRELDQAIGGGPGDLSSALSSFRKVPWGARRRKSDFFDDFWEGKIWHGPRLRAQSPLGGSRERFEEASGMKI